MQEKCNDGADKAPDAQLGNAVAGLRNLADKRKSFIGDPAVAKAKDEAEADDDLSSFL